MDAVQTKIYSAILITAITIGGILVYFIFSLIKHQKRNNKLHRSKILAEITTLENERTRIANDLHDELGPLLSAIKFKLSSIETTLPEDATTLAHTNDHIVDIIQRMREISNDLMPNTLMRKGLAYAIEEFISKISHNNNVSGLKIDFVQTNFPRLSKEKEINIYRVVQEIIHNTIKHAGAKELKISLYTEDNNIILITTDNGVGFDYINATKENRGLGMRSMLSRTEIMDGNLFIESKPGKGTNYTIEIPTN